MMTMQSKMLVLVGIGGTWYFVSKAGLLDGTGFSFNDLINRTGISSDLSAAAQSVQQNAIRNGTASSAPKVPATAYIGAATSIGATVAGLFSGGGGAAAGGAVAAAGGGAAAGGATILGVSLATAAIVAGVVIVVFFAFRWFMRQNSSKYTNRVRDQWQAQFVDLHRQMGFKPIPPEILKGNGPGNLEMAEIIYYFDHDDSQQLWKAVTKTQDVDKMRAAANAIDDFLTRQGIPVQDVAA